MSNIITLLENKITERLALIKLAGVAVKVYPYIPGREKGEVEPPCIGWQRLGHHEIKEDRRASEWLFVPSEEEITTELPRSMGGGEVTGPASYTRKPYPTPLSIPYEFHVMATNRTHSDFLLQAMYSVIPPDYSPLLDGQSPMFVHDKPINLDDLSIPEFRTSFVYDVRPVWIDRLTSWPNASITTIDLTISAS